MTEPLLQVIDLVKRFPVRHGFFGHRRTWLVAVDRMSFTIDHGETLGLVGESGCGKSTLGLTILRLQEPTSGRVLLEGRDLAGVSGKELRQLRRRMQMIFQDPLAALDPRLTVEQIIREPLDIHHLGSRAERAAIVRSLASTVRLPADALRRFPGEFSGGQQQRIGIARALALQPDLLVCDEPVSALDVSVQAQILNLLRDLQDRLGLSYLFISHDIAVTAFMSRRIGVMYLGRLMEIGPAREVVTRPCHPYTRALLAAVPEPDPERRRTGRALIGDAPSPIHRPSGCPFHPRCPIARDLCAEEEPVLHPTGPDHLAACHFA